MFAAKGRPSGHPLIAHVLETATIRNLTTTTVVIGHQSETLAVALAGYRGLTFVVQEPQLGTGHALMTSEAALAGQTETLILLSGDVPLLTAATLKILVDHHRTTGASATVVTQSSTRRTDTADCPPGQPIARIVEQKDATTAEQAIREINSGIYAFELEGLFEALRRIASENAQREYYLPDLVAIYRQAGRTVETVTVSNPDEIRGINSRLELAAVSRIVRDQKTAELMAAGVTIEDPATAYVDAGVTIGADTILHPAVSIEGSTTIGGSCEIHSGSRIVDSRIGDRVTS